MAVEIEAKMRIDSVETMAQRLRDIAAHYQGSVLEHNIYFDTLQADMKSSDEGLRLRCETPDEEDSVRCIVTYKGPRQPGPLKTRREIEIIVSDAAETEALLVALKYKKVLAFQKRRQTWQCNDCEVVLDTLPQLGDFLEIEGPGEAEVEAVRHRLGLDHEPLITDSYLGLICTYLDEHGMGRPDLLLAEAT